MNQQQDPQRTKTALRMLLFFAIIVFGVTVFICTSILRKKEKKMKHTKSFIRTHRNQGFENEASKVERQDNLHMKHNHLKEQIHLSEQGISLRKNNNEEYNEQLLKRSYKEENNRNEQENEMRETILIQDTKPSQETEEEDKEIKELLRKRIDERQHQEMEEIQREDDKEVGDKKSNKHNVYNTNQNSMKESITRVTEEKTTTHHDDVENSHHKMRNNNDDDDDDDDDDEDIPIIDPSTLEPGYYGDTEHFDQAVFADTKPLREKQDKAVDQQNQAKKTLSNAVSLKQPIPKKKCKTTVQTRQFLTDSRGVQCSVFDIDPVTQCCMRGKQFTCAGECQGGCCRSYPACVSCCTSNTNREAISRSFLAIKQHAKQHIRVLYRDITVTTPIFDFCITRCRTSSQSVINENQYRDELKYCYAS